MESFIRNKNADYFKRFGFRCKKVGVEVIFNQLFDPVFEDYEGDFAKFNKKIMRAFESVILENPEEIKKITETIENRIETEKQEKTALAENIAQKIAERQQEQEKEEKLKPPKPKTERQIYHDKLKEMDKEELIKIISENVHKADKDYLIDLAFELKTDF